MTDYRLIRVPVAGGRLAVGDWRESETASMPVLAIHGITASHREWPFIAERLDGIRVIAPDLRGRARSNGLPPPWGMRDHADDMARLLDELGVERALVVGHSMGGFVSVRMAEQHPDRVARLVLIDGGLPLPSPRGVPRDELPSLLLGPAGERLSRRYASREEYAAFWRGHPAFRQDWSDEVARYVDYDLDEVPGGFRPSSRFEAIATNVVQQDGGDGYTDALAGLRVSVDFLRAPRGLLDEATGLYPDAVLRPSLGLVTGMRLHEIEDVNHYTIVMSARGAAAVAPVVRAAHAETESEVSAQ